MKKLLLLIFLNLLVLLSFAQKSLVIDAFTKHGIDSTILEAQTKRRSDNYAFDYKYTSISGNKETVTTASFDPSKPEQDRWTMISVKGKTPSTSEIKAFRKNHSQPQPIASKVDESTYKIEKEYIYNEKEKRYFTESEDLNLIVKFLGQLAPMETISEYSNYRKI